MQSDPYKIQVLDYLKSISNLRVAKTYGIEFQISYLNYMMAQLPQSACIHYFPLHFARGFRKKNKSHLSLTIASFLAKYSAICFKITTYLFEKSICHIIPVTFSWDEWRGKKVKLRERKNRSPHYLRSCPALKFITPVNSLTKVDF